MPDLARKGIFEASETVTQIHHLVAVAHFTRPTIARHVCVTPRPRGSVFVASHGIKAIYYTDAEYPERLADFAMTHL